MLKKTLHGAEIFIKAEEQSCLIKTTGRGFRKIQPEINVFFLVCVLPDIGNVVQGLT